VGKELLERVFAWEGARQRVIIATTDVRALVRYLKTGVYARFPIYSFSRSPRAMQVPGDLEAEPMTGSAEQQEQIAAIDRQIVEHRRDEDHAYLRAQRQGFLYKRGGQAVGYGYVGKDGGPFAILDPADYPAVLAHAEGAANQLTDHFYLEVPLINTQAVDYLLAQEYQMSAFTTLFMSATPFGRFENYIFPSPPFFM
jgi:hypothetical protein